MSFEPVPESDGREFTWIKGDLFNSGHFGMFLVRFKSKFVAANFQMLFASARELRMLELRSRAAAETSTDAAVTTATTTASTSATTTATASATTTATTIESCSAAREHVFVPIHPRQISPHPQPSPSVLVPIPIRPR